MRALLHPILRASALLAAGWVAPGPAFPDSEPVSLGSILAPVVIEERATAARPAPPPPEPVLRAPDPETVEIGLEAVLLRLESLASEELDPDSRLTLRSTARWQPLEIPATATWELVLRNAFSPDNQGRWYASFSILVEGEPAASRLLRVDASLFKEVWMVQQRLNRGDSPVMPAVKAVLRDIFLERGNPVPASENLRSYELVRSVSEGRLLTWDDLKQRPAVRRGNVVDVVVQQGAMTVTMRARSLEDGLLGDSVAVRNLESHRELVGTVIGEDRIQFHP